VLTFVSQEQDFNYEEQYFDYELSGLLTPTKSHLIKVLTQNLQLQLQFIISLNLSPLIVFRPGISSFMYIHRLYTTTV